MSKLRIMFYTGKNKVMFWLYILIFNIKLFLKIPTLPYKLTMKLNDNCNLSCNYCNIWKNTDLSILDVSSYQKFINYYSKHLRILSLTWWEIFLLKDIENRILYALSHCEKLNIFSFTSNGFLTEKILSVVKNILRLHPKIIIIINISIDWDKNIHNKLRWNKLSYQKAIHSYNQLRKLIKHYPNLEVNQEFLITEQNQHLLKEKLEERNNILSFVQNSDYYWINNISIKKIKFSKILYKNISGYMKRKFIQWYLSNKYDCFAVRSSLFIDWTWEIKPCIKWNTVISKIQNLDLIDILKSRSSLKLVKNIQEKKCPWCWTPCEGYLSIIHQYRK